jgi:hypothetical protein
MLFEPVVKLRPELSPSKTFPLPVVIEKPELVPTATLFVPVVVSCIENAPMPVLFDAENPIIKRATVTKKGKLTDEFLYLESFVYEDEFRAAHIK